MDLNELHPIIELINLQEERLVKKLDEIIEHQKKTNGRVGKSEDDIIKITGNCANVQQDKVKAAERSKRAIDNGKWLVGTLIVIIGILAGLNIKQKKDDMLPIEIIYKNTDSTFTIPGFYIRKEGEQVYREVHKLYVDIDETLNK